MKSAVRTGPKPSKLNVTYFKKGGAAKSKGSKICPEGKAWAKRTFDTYPSAYANAWLVRTYKKRGGGYRSS